MKIGVKALRALFVLGMGVQPLPAAVPTTLAPKDECTALPGFAAFRKQLAQAVSRKDGAALRNMVTDGVANGFGGDDGKAAFIRQWGLAKPASSPVWRELGRLIPLGCARTSPSEATIPYAAERLPGDESAFYYVPSRIGVALRAAPSANAPVVMKLGWDLLIDRDSESAPVGWSGVTTRLGQKGFVADDDVVSAGGQRLYLSRKNGQWRITGFLSGD